MVLITRVCGMLQQERKQDNELTRGSEGRGRAEPEAATRYKWAEKGFGGRNYAGTVLCLSQMEGGGGNGRGRGPAYAVPWYTPWSVVEGA